MRRRLTILLFAALLLAAIAAPVLAQNGVTVRANVDLRLRARPSTRSSQILAVIPQGVEVTATGINAAHTWVQASYYSFTGWLYVRYLTVVEGDLSTLPVIDTGSSGGGSGNSTGETPPSSTQPPIESLPNVPSGQTYDCPRYCRDYTSCEQALYCLAQGATRLDRDGDGSPCEQPEYVCPAR